MSPVYAVEVKDDYDYTKGIGTIVWFDEKEYHKKEMSKTKRLDWNSGFWREYEIQQDLEPQEKPKQTPEQTSEQLSELIERLSAKVDKLEQMVLSLTLLNKECDNSGK